LTTATEAPERVGPPSKAARPHPIRNLLIKRSLIGILTLVLVSILVFAATQTLPGNAASAVLQNTATPQRLHALEVQLGLTRPAVEQYWTWLTGVLHGNFFFAAVVIHWFPAVSVFVPGTAPWSNPKELVLPVATLVIVVVPYVFRMMRASMIDALESDYVQMARLKGVPKWRVLLFHALPNAIAPTIQGIGLTFLYLAGGVVVVEYLFNYPGLGQALVSAVSDRDIRRSRPSCWSSRPSISPSTS
jgi:peptide/nickel transport system permease protein